MFDILQKLQKYIISKRILECIVVKAQLLETENTKKYTQQSIFVMHDYAYHTQAYSMHMTVMIIFIVQSMH